MSDIMGGTRFKLVESYRNGLIGHLFGQKEFVAPTEYYFGISLTQPNEEGGNIKEPLPSSGYERVRMPVDAATWTQANDGAVKNVNEIRMNELQIDSGIANYWFLSETPDGDAIGYAALDYTRPLVIYSTIIIEPEELEVYIPH